MNDYENEELTDEELESREKEATEIAENNIDDTSNEVETELNTQNKMAELSAEKAIIDLLLKKKKIAIFAVIVGVFAIFLIFVAVMTGSEVNEYEYIEPKCTNVTINYDPFGPDEGSEITMPLEEYVKNATYAYAMEYTSENADNIHIYTSLAISLRTEALANDCKVTYHDKTIDNNFEENKSIERALEIASGVVMVDENDNYINSKVSSFCWNNSDEEEYTLFQNNLKVPNTFTDIYLNNNIYEHCPCNDPQGDAFDEDNPYSDCWITWDSDDDGEDDESEWLHQENETGYSFYGASYLLKNQGFTFNDILKYFYGDKIYLKTTIEGTKEIEETTNNSNSNCMWWPIGSDETTVENGVTLASGDPATVAITSNYGYRNQPIAGASTFHKAIDIGNGQEGKTNIIASASGIVISINTGCIAGDNSCGGQLGNYVKIKHNDGTITRYGHMYSVNVNEGDSVVQGQVIGKMGNTGNSTGPHLDFQILVNGEAVDPLNYVSPSNPRKKCYSSIINGDTNQQTVCLSLLNYGPNYSINAITGIMANIQAESGFNPRAINSSSGAYGLVQWLGGRKTGLMNACDINLNENEYINCQVRYIFQELNSSEANANKFLTKDASASEMAFYVCKYYERPEKGVCESGLRQDYANNLLNYVSNGCN